jgi:hypothetical protein
MVANRVQKKYICYAEPPPAEAENRLRSNPRQVKLIMLFRGFSATIVQAEV